LPVWNKDSGLASTRALHVDSSDDSRVDGSDGTQGVWKKFDAALGGEETPTIAFTGTAKAVHVDSSGNVYTGVFDRFGTQLYKYNSAGTLQWSDSTLGGGIQDIVEDSNGDIIVVGSDSIFLQRLMKISSAGVVAWNVPSAIDNRLVVVGTDIYGTQLSPPHALFKYNTSGILQWSAADGTGQGSGGLGYNPATGNIWTAGAAFTAHIAEFNSSGTLISEFSYDTFGGEVPTDLIVDSDGNIVVTMLGLVRKYSSAGVLLKTFDHGTNSSPSISHELTGIVRIRQMPSSLDYVVTGAVVSR